MLPVRDYLSLSVIVKYMEKNLDTDVTWDANKNKLFLKVFVNCHLLNSVRDYKNAWGVHAHIWLSRAANNCRSSHNGRPKFANV